MLMKVKVNIFPWDFKCTTCIYIW